MRNLTFKIKTNSFPKSVTNFETKPITSITSTSSNKAYSSSTISRKKPKSKSATNSIKSFSPPIRLFLKSWEKKKSTSSQKDKSLFF